MELLELKIQVKGEVVSSNVKAFREGVTTALAEVNRDLQTDEQFGQAEIDAKALKEAEAAVSNAKTKALEDAKEIHFLLSELDGCGEEIRQARLDLERQIKEQKTKVRNALAADVLESIPVATAAAKRAYLPRLQDAIKGKRTLKSLKSALENESLMIEAEITKCREIIDAAPDGICPDVRQLETMQPDALQAEIERRIDVKAEKEKADKLAAELAEERAKAEAKRKEEEERDKPPEPEAKPEKPLEAMAKEETARVQPFLVEKEWETFKDQIRQAFAPLKKARAGLRNNVNIYAAKEFAKAVGLAWEKLDQWRGRVDA